MAEYTFYCRVAGQVIQRTAEFATTEQAIEWGKLWREQLRNSMTLQVDKVERVKLKVNE
jgi:hypothetical protein